MSSSAGRNPGWDLLSLGLHAALFAALLFCTPVRTLVLTPRDSAPRESTPPPREKIEQLDEKLAEARSRELQRDLTALQTVLNDMDVVRDQLRQDFDDVVQDLAADAKDELRKAAEEARKLEAEALAEQEKTEKAVDRLATAEKQDLEQSAKTVAETANHLYWNEFMDVAEKQANAQNALDAIQTAASFAGLEDVAKTASDLRDAQIAAARTQSSEAEKILEPADKIAEFTKAMETKASEEKKAEAERKTEAAERDKKEKAEAEKKQAAEKRAQAEERRATAEKERNASDADKRKAQREKDAAENAKRQAENRKRDAENRARSAENDEKNAQKRGDQKAAEAAAKRKEDQRATAANEAEKAQAAAAEAKAAHERANEAERARADAQRRADAARSERDRADNERRAAENRERDAANREKNAAARAKDHSTAAEKAAKKAEELKAYARSLDADAQRRRQQNAKKAQQAVMEAMAKLDSAIDRDIAKPRSHATDEMPELELANRNTVDMSISEAYEFARNLEEAVTEAYREVVAASTAISQHIPLEEAERLTDVAKPVREDFDANLLDGRATTPEELAAQKEARYKAVRETEDMVDASMAMMNEAFRLAGVGTDGEFTNGDPRHARGLNWLQRGSLAGRGDRARAEHFIALGAMSMQIERMAAEDRSARSKDLTGIVMGGVAVAGTDGPDKDFKRVAGRAGDFTGQPQSRENAGTGSDLIPGNVLSVSESSRGMPAGWMYLDSWWVIGPFPNPDRVNITRKFPPESVIDLDAAYEGEGGLVKWEFVQARSPFPRDRLNRHRPEVIPPNRREFAIWYGYTLLRVDADCDVWLAAGSDDRSDVWVNGMKVWASGNNRKVWTVDEGFRRVHLHKGANSVLVRLENGPGPTSFSVCISPHDTPPPL